MSKLSHSEEIDMHLMMAGTNYLNEAAAIAELIEEVIDGGDTYQKMHLLAVIRQMRPDIAPPADDFPWQKTPTARSK